MPGSEPNIVVKGADEQPAKKRKRQDKKAKRAKAQKLPVLTQSFTHNKILDAQERLLKGQEKREERVKARISKAGSLKKKGKLGGTGGS